MAHCSELAVRQIVLMRDLNAIFLAEQVGLPSFRRKLPTFFCNLSV
jgi:hypothetical protein